MLGGGGKTGSMCCFAFSLFCSVWGSQDKPRCWEKQHEKCHHTDSHTHRFCAPQMLATNKDLGAVSLYASKQSTRKRTKGPHFARTQGGGW